LIEAVSQYDGSVAKLKLDITELERLAIDRERVVNEQAAKLAEQLSLHSDLIAD